MNSGPAAGKFRKMSNSAFKMLLYFALVSVFMFKNRASRRYVVAKGCKTNYSFSDKVFKSSEK